MTSFSPEVLSWLLEGDPAIRWQVMRDLLDEPEAVYQAERARVAESGWGRQLLDLQDPGGTWADGIYSPKWISTTYTLLLLRHCGLEPGTPEALRGCERIWDAARINGGIIVHQGNAPPDICVNGMWVTLAQYFGHADTRLNQIVNWVLDQQLADGGWNCTSLRSGSAHGSFHTTITVLEMLAELQTAGTTDVALDDAAATGEEFMLQHRLYKSHRTGAVAHRTFTMLSFPPRWRHDVLRGLDYFRSVEAPRDDRLDDALELLQSKKRADGTWPVQQKYAGQVWFEMEKTGRSSRWNTLRALRVLRWAESRTK